MPASTAVSVGAIDLKSPLICGLGEHLMYAQGIRRALAAGAAAVVSKSTNESEAARRQLDRTDYVLLDSEWRRLPWDFSPPADASLLCRSGLAQQPFDEWLAMLAGLDRGAKTHDAYVVASLVLADLDRCVEMARAVEQAGLRILSISARRTATRRRPAPSYWSETAFACAPSSNAYARRCGFRCGSS